MNTGLAEPFPPVFRRGTYWDAAFSLDLGSGLLINTGLELKEQGGKLRLRIVGADMQVQRQLTTALMMPEPVRADAGLGAGAPMLQKNRHAVENIEIEQVVLTNPNLAVLSLGKMDFRNRSHPADEIQVPKRAAEITDLWNRQTEFPDDIAALIKQHQAAVKGGGPVGAAIEAALGELERRVADRSADTQEGRCGLNDCCWEKKRPQFKQSYNPSSASSTLRLPHPTTSFGHRSTSGHLGVDSGAFGSM